MSVWCYLRINSYILFILSAITSVQAPLSSSQKLLSSSSHLLSLLWPYPCHSNPAKTHHNLTLQLKTSKSTPSVFRLWPKHLAYFPGLPRSDPPCSRLFSHDLGSTSTTVEFLLFPVLLLSLFMLLCPEFLHPSAGFLVRCHILPGPAWALVSL